MPRILHASPATLALLTLLSPALAQSSGGTIRPGTDRDVTTGIGTGSSFRNVQPPPGELPVANTRPLYWDTPEANEKPVQKQGGETTESGKETAVSGVGSEPPPEDPRSTITRDRIESPQHR